MSQTDKGVLIFYEWFEAMETLSPKSYKEMMTAIRRYQQKGEEPPEFKGKSAIAAAIIFPYIRRRIDAARAAKIGIQTRFTEYDAKTKLQEMLQKHAPKK